MHDGGEPEAAGEFDAIVIGTGFGGAVAACRLAEAGLRICVLERGRRYESVLPGDSRTQPQGEPLSDFPRLPRSDRIMPDATRWQWQSDQGLWQFRNLGDIDVLQAAGYGGGSLVYANVHLRPPPEHFDTWPEAYRARRNGLGEVEGELEKYFDLVAWMLDVKPITTAETVPDARAAGLHQLRKTGEMREVARALGRESAFFHPPLAINFQRTDRNRHGRAQGACTACGECDTGCRYRAKNTLDLNYLARAEDATLQDGSPAAEIRTMAEALRIEATCALDNGRYRVHYRDHLRGRQERVVAGKFVFVCAGAVNTTELLLRSASARNGLPRLSDRLGHGYYPNADALGMVYDARLPGPPGEAARRQIGATRGPTITSSLVYQGPPDDPHEPHDRLDRVPWFLLQEGGFPPALARHVGLMRAPVLLRRNRFVDRAADLGLEVIPGYEAGGTSALPQPTDLEAQLPVVFNFLDGAIDNFRNDQLSRAVPPTIRRAIDELSAELRRWSREHVDEVAERALDELIALKARNTVRLLTFGSTGPPWLRRLVHRMLNWVFRCVISQEEIHQASNDAFEGHLELDDPVEAAARVARFCFGFNDDKGCHSNQAMVLLAMGRDDRAGTIALQDDRGLTIQIPAEPRPVHSVQERMMRDVAATLGGRLRVSPGWAYARRPITVHSQGGCPIGDSLETGVLDLDGQLLRKRSDDDTVGEGLGIYVLDGAALPDSVGVNPSATIAALAERNVETFLRRIRRRSRAEADMDAAQAWLGRLGEVQFRPPPVVDIHPPRTRPIAITFTELMSGTFAEPDDTLREALAEAGPSPGPGGTPLEARLYEAAAQRGRPDNGMELTLHARVPDVNVLALGTHRLEVEGTAELRLDGTDLEPLRVQGWFDLLTGEGETRSMDYELRIGRRFELSGIKKLRDDPGADVWRDTTALFIHLRDLEQERDYYGMLNVAMNHFLFKQMRSMQVDTVDAARAAWALSSFGAHFFGGLQSVYFPALDDAIRRFREMEVR
jgi:choline dehydrogenase-like flavoprotein